MWGKVWRTPESQFSHFSVFKPLPRVGLRLSGSSLAGTWL